MDLPICSYAQYLDKAKILSLEFFFFDARDGIFIENEQFNSEQIFSREKKK